MERDRQVKTKLALVVMLWTLSELAARSNLETLLNSRGIAFVASQSSLAEKSALESRAVAMTAISESLVIDCSFSMLTQKP